MDDDSNKTTYLQLDGVYTLLTDLRTAFPKKPDPILYATLAVVGELAETAAKIAAGGSPARKDVVDELGDVLLSFLQVNDIDFSFDYPSRYPSSISERAPGVLIHDALRAAGLMAEMVKKCIGAGKTGADVTTIRYEGLSFMDYVKQAGEPVAALIDMAGPTKVMAAARNKLDSRVRLSGLRAGQSDSDPYRNGHNY